MSQPDLERKKALEQALSQIKKQFGEGAIIHHHEVHGRQPRRGGPLHKGAIGRKEGVAEIFNHGVEGIPMTFAG